MTDDLVVDLTHFEDMFGLQITASEGRGMKPEHLAYNASKFGLNGFSEALLLDTRYDNVRVSTVLPGSVATEFGRNEGNADLGKDWKVHPEDVAAVVRTLLAMPERTMVSQVEIRPAKPKRS